MYRRSTISLVTLSALLLAGGCSRPKKSETSSSAGASTPTISASTETTEPGSSTPVRSPVTYSEAESTFTSGDYSGATDLFTRYTEGNPENAWGFYMLGVASWKSGHREQAVEAFDRALQLDPDHSKSLFNSSRVLLELNQPKEALRRIEQALSREPMSNEGLRLLGRVRYQLGQVDDAIAAYQKALSVDPEDAWAMNNLGLIYLDQNRIEEALPPLARAVEIKTHAPVFQNNLGMALERSGHPVAAAKAYETAIGLDSTYQKASVGLARVTGGVQQEEETPVDLPTLSQHFQQEIAGWRESPTDSTVQSSTDSGLVIDSTHPLGLSDSSRASVEGVSDSLEDCQQE
jgi:tetratricopeptide (TPR) repeat protein